MIYTTGYTGRKPDNLKRIADRLDAVVLDIRFSADSRVPYWRKDSLAALLGSRYLHLPALGNVNYREHNLATIKLQSLDAGLNVIRSLLPANLILICACAKRELCHRSMVAVALEANGFAVTELGGW